MNEKEKPIPPDEEIIENTDDTVEEEPPEVHRVSLFVGIMLIVATLFTTLVGWEQDSVDSADIVEIEFNQAQARVISNAQARQNYVIYSYYLANNELGNQIAVDDESIETYSPLLTQADLLASNNRFFFPGRYLNPDGSYDFDRNAEEVMAEIAQRNMIDSSALIRDSEKALERRLQFMQIIFALGLSMGILGLAELFYWERKFTRYSFIASGLIILFTSILAYFLLSPNPLQQLGLG